MSGAADEPAPARAQTRGSACGDCRRRSWLLGELSAVLDLNCRADGRLFELLALEDGALVQALGGRQRAELQRGYANFRADRLPGAREAAELCIHDGRFPRELSVAGACPMLYVEGGLERLRELTHRPVVAVVGTACASDYGRAAASDLARGLAASGITVAGLLSGGIASAALAGALDGGGGTLAIAGSGLDTLAAMRRRVLRNQVMHGGCAVSALAGGVSGRRWGAAVAERVLATLAAVTLVVEAHERPRELVVARIAQSLGGTVAAVPGRVTSPAASGCHELLRGGAQLVRDAADVLELLYEVDRPAPAQPTVSAVSDRAEAELEPRLRAVLKRVGAGEDTPGRLAADQSDSAEVLRALGELELLGLLSRGDGGRYVVRTSGMPSMVRYVG
jgi:DNA processing protein